MKVLRFAQYIMNPKYKEHSRNRTGYGRSVWDISRHSAIIGNDEYLYTYGNRSEINDENVNILSGVFSNVLKSINIETIICVLSAIKLTLRMKNTNIRKKLFLILNNLKYGYVQNIINEINPDIIHIHGLTYSTYPLIKAAQKSNVPYVITLHGLNVNIVSNESERMFELDQISRLNKQGVHITVIGSGMKKTIIERCDISNPNIIEVINHGIDSNSFILSLDKSQVREKLGLLNRKLVLSVGSLSENRNQICLINAISRMPKEEIDQIVVFIVGEGPTKSILQSAINKLCLTDTIFLVGQKSYEELSEMYTVASITAVLSKVEGFGRPILESFLFGVPVVAFEDLDAVQDLSKEGCLHIVCERTEEAVCEKLKEVLFYSEIDQSIIKDFASTKTWTKALLDYQSVYSNAISNNKSNSNSNDKGKI